MSKETNIYITNSQCGDVIEWQVPSGVRRLSVERSSTSRNRSATPISRF